LKADLEKIDGVRVFNPQGKAIGHISLPERCPNLCFGGREGNRLFLASSHSIYSLFVNTRGTGLAVYGYYLTASTAKPPSISALRMLRGEVKGVHPF